MLSPTRHTRAPGRPSKLTPDRLALLLSATRYGATRRAAAEAAGIGETTFRRWMQRGRTERAGEYRRFRAAVQTADAEAEIRLLAKIHGADDWRAAAWILERRFPKRWGRHEHRTHAADPIAPPFGNAVFVLDLPPFPHQRPPLALAAGSPLPVDADLLEITE